MDDEDLIELPQSKQCLCCKQMKAIEQFQQYSKGKDGLYPMCKECEAKKSRSAAQRHRPSERKKYTEFMMHSLHLTGKDY